MIRGLFSSLHFPYAQFPCASVTGDLFSDPFWEAVFRLERCGFKVCTSMLKIFIQSCTCIIMYIFRCWAQHWTEPVRTSGWRRLISVMQNLYFGVTSGWRRYTIPQQNSCTRSLTPSLMDEVFLFSEPPHLIKTTWYFSSSSSRSLWVSADFTCTTLFIQWWSSLSFSVMQNLYFGVTFMQALYKRDTEQGSSTSQDQVRACQPHSIFKDAG